MRNAACTGAVSRRPVGAQEAVDYKKKLMSKIKLILALMTIVAIIVIAMAVYVFTNFSAMDVTRSIILIVIAIVGMIIIMGILILIYKNNNPRK